MGKVKDLKGMRFGKLTVIELVGRNSRNLALWSCLCDCGNEKVVVSRNMIMGSTKSCGCWRKERMKTLPEKVKHGMTGTKFYAIWWGMKSRCFNEKYPHFKRYGGRGIKVCERWLDFNNFVIDMLPSYKEGLTLERKDNNKDYSKDNCKWATRLEQSNNMSRNKMLTYEGETLSMSNMAKKYNIPFERFRTRIRRGWSVERAILKG